MSEFDKTEQKLEAVRIKDEGNQAYSNEDFETAILKFTNAIEIDSKNETFYCNRSMTYFILKEYIKSIQDAKVAIELSTSKPYVKAYHYLIKSYMELNKFKEAKYHLLIALNACGNIKELITLENEYISKTGHSVRPKPSDFEILEEIGDGNYTKVFKAKHRHSNQIYAIKVIDKATIERMKRRQHPNISNEILMEKRVLSKLDFPLIITLYSTFQDNSSLYYQMEYSAGGELWNYLKDDNYGLSASVGCYPSIVSFFMMEAINAVEHMHRHGIVHRDIKPENILVSPSGHLKLIDFGTAKDLIETDLNGPEFVGTSEYFSPFTVNSKPVGIDGDLWALGILLFQLLTGFTPFKAPSPYLIFLRIQRANLRFPNCVSHDACELIRLLLNKNAANRVVSGTGDFEFSQNLRQHEYLKKQQHENSKTIDLSQSIDKVDNFSTKSKLEVYPVEAMSRDWLHKLNYNALRRHSYFNQLKKQIHIYEHIEGLNNCSDVHHSQNNYIVSEFASSDDFQSTETLFSRLHCYPAIRVPSLRDICIRSVAKACLKVSEIISNYAGLIPSEMPWVSSFTRILPSLQSHRLAKNPLTNSTITELDTQINITNNPDGEIRDFNESNNTQDFNEIIHFLDRCDRLYPSAVYRLFFKSSIDSRLIKIMCLDRNNKLSSTCIGTVNSKRDECKEREQYEIGSGSNMENTNGITSSTDVQIKNQNCIHIELDDLQDVKLKESAVDSSTSSKALNQYSPKLRQIDCVREYLGYSYEKQGHYDKDYFFIQFSSPLLDATDSRDGISLNLASKVDGSDLTDNEELTHSRKANSFIDDNDLRAIISAINKLRPKFVVCSGNFTMTSVLDIHKYEYKYNQELTHFKRSMGRISDSIPILLVPGENDIGEAPTVESIRHYRQRFGVDYYGFWYSGSRCLVINSPLLRCPQNAIDDAKLQDAWLEEEIELAKLCSEHVIIFSHHPWFIFSQDEEDDISHYRTIPKGKRMKWIKILRHSKVKYLFAGHCDMNHSAKAFSLESSQELKIGANADDLDSNVDSEGDENDDDDIGHANEEKDYFGPTSVITSAIVSTNALYNRTPNNSSTEMPKSSSHQIGMRLVKVYESEMKHQFYSLNDVPKSVAL